MCAAVVSALAADARWDDNPSMALDGLDEIGDMAPPPTIPTIKPNKLNPRLTTIRLRVMDSSLSSRTMEATTEKIKATLAEDKPMWKCNHRKTPIEEETMSIPHLQDLPRQSSRERERIS